MIEPESEYCHRHHCNYDECQCLWCKECGELLTECQGKFPNCANRPFAYSTLLLESEQVAKDQAVLLWAIAILALAMALTWAFTR